MSGSRWHRCWAITFPLVRSATSCPYGPLRSPKRVEVGIFVGMGSDSGWPSIIGLGHPPAVPSKPFRLKIIFNASSHAPIDRLLQFSLPAHHPLAKLT